MKYIFQFCRILAGVRPSLGSITALALLLKLDAAQAATLLHL